MTIAVKIQNLESPDDKTKELIVETLRPDGTTFGFQTIHGGQEVVCHVHSAQGLKITERFVDRANQYAPR